MTEADANEVLAMLAKERGLPLEKISPSSRLLQDLGMDGDDAVDFFLSVQQRFGTDLTALQARWGDHFGPEGFSLWYGLVIVTAGIIGGIAAGLLHLGVWGGLAITVALLALWLWLMKEWGPKDRTVPITVSDLIAAVEAGAWPKDG